MTAVAVTAPVEGSITMTPPFKSSVMSSPPGVASRKLEAVDLETTCRIGSPVLAFSVTML